jgi:phosphofructokinase-like protein
MTKKRRLGILTGGGDCPGLNAVIRAIAKPAIQEYGFEVIGFEDGYLGLIEKRFRILSDTDVSGILSRGGTILGTSNRSNPFKQTYRKGRETVFKDVSKAVLKTVAGMNLEGLIAIGGDGTLSIAERLFNMGLNVIGVPKTIDNDLSDTDVTFGFDSAVAVATEALDRLHTTAESHHRVMILEVMGRYAGWIALYAGVAGGGDAILIPEIPFHMPSLYRLFSHRLKLGKKFSIVVVAEGAYPFKGERKVARLVKESTDPVRLGGIAAFLAEEIESHTRLETRSTVLGHLQRGGSPTAYDRILATQFGNGALRLFLDGKFGEMVALHGNEINSVKLRDAIGKLKTVPLNHALIQTARSVGTSFGD